MSDKKKKSGAADLFTPQNITAEAKRIAAIAKETDVLVEGVPNLDGTYEEYKDGERQKEVPLDVFHSLADQIAAAAPNTSFLLIAVGPSDTPPAGAPPKRCSIFVHSANASLSPVAWLGACHVSDVNESGRGEGGEGGGGRAFGYFACEFPAKEKDQVASMAFSFLRKNGFLKDDDSDDERPTFDINADE